MAKPKNLNLYNKWIGISLGVIIILVVWFYVFQGFGNRFDFDEEKYIRNSLSEDGYNVIDVRLEGTSIYAKLSCPLAFSSLCVKSLSDSSTWILRLNMIMNTLATAYEEDPLDIEEMPKKELRELGIDPSEVLYMSDEELEETSEIIARRASTYIVIIHSSLETCSYRLSRSTYKTCSDALDIDPLSDISTLLCTKQDKEIINSETCY